MRIVNLTQHSITEEQKLDGVIEVSVKKEVTKLLTFNDLPSIDEMETRARGLASIAKKEGATAAMIGGAPYLMAYLELALIESGIEPIYSYSRRDCTEERSPDGSVRKMMVFRHKGFVRPFPSEVNSELGEKLKLV
nr:hypothetical protein [uncultured Dethiosulfovibrio sp.]